MPGSTSSSAAGSSTSASLVHLWKAIAPMLVMVAGSLSCVRATQSANAPRPDRLERPREAHRRQVDAAGKDVVADGLHVRRQRDGGELDAANKGAIRKLGYHDVLPILLLHPIGHHALPLRRVSGHSGSFSPAATWAAPAFFRISSEAVCASLLPLHGTSFGLSTGNRLPSFERSTGTVLRSGLDARVGEVDILAFRRFRFRLGEFEGPFWQVFGCAPCGLMLVALVEKLSYFRRAVLVLSAWLTFAPPTAARALPRVWHASRQHKLPHA